MSRGSRAEPFRTVWGVTSYDKGGNSGFVVHALFTTKEQAEVYASEDPDEYDVEEFALYDQAPKPYTYWHRGASVFPDGKVDDWTVEHTAQEPECIDPVECAKTHGEGYCKNCGTFTLRVSASFEAARE